MIWAMTTGKMAVKILTGEADISTMPVEYAPQVTKKYNAANCETLGITVPGWLRSHRRRLRYNER